MRKVAYIVLSTLVVYVLANSPALAQTKKGDAAQAAMITQDKAQQLAVQKYPGAQVISSKMDTVKGNSVWVVSFTRTGGNISEKVMVDAQSGKVTKM